jgi:cysteine-rich repeat protein
MPTTLRRPSIGSLVLTLGGAAFGLASAACLSYATSPCQSCDPNDDECIAKMCGGTGTASTTEDTTTTTTTTTTTQGTTLMTTTSMTTTTMSTTSTTTMDPTTTTTTGDPVCDENLICDGEEDIAGCLHDCGTCRADASCDGAMETPYSCPEDCDPTSCNHDGVIDALEEQCDDGNMEDGDACTNACGKAKCGDGVQWADGGEECDDGNGEDGDGCSAGCLVEHRVVFVTSANYSGILGGLAGADKICQDLADTASLGGTFKAWLSDGTMSPSSRFGINPEFSGPFELVDGTVIAQGWKDLTDGSLLHAIDIDETGITVMTSTVWTNTTVAGDPLGTNHCASWSSSDVDGTVGLSNKNDSEWTQKMKPMNACASGSRLYCFQTQ